MMLVTANHGSGYQRRLATGGLSTWTQGALSGAPYWVRLVRTGNIFDAYSSSDGANWTLLASDSISMAAPIYVGLAVTAHNNAALNTSTFSDVRFPGLPAGAARLTLVQFDRSGRILIRIEGQLGRTYGIEASSDLLTWKGVTTVVDQTCPILFIDAAAANQAQRFYRAVLMP
jgi:hypothetical protein